ncbi:MAG: sigma 54-interacting transcriptional regulator [Polyangiaceae bacterium]
MAARPRAAAASTLDVDRSTSQLDGADREVLALLVAWAPAEASRVGEVALFEPDDGARILGRGDSSGAGERVWFQRQRPGVSERTGPLTSPGLSREQLRVRVENGSLRVERVGKCPVLLAGREVDTCTLRPGDALVLRGQMVLYCTRRPWSMAPLASARLEDAPVFGAPDRHGIVGESPVTWRLRDRLAWTAGAEEHTLLLGESGSGKELCARAIHALGARRKGPFVARNAATIPASLVDAELFGNVKGYPNPGMPERPGLVGAADGGTLFLDEIGELPSELQANLLRVLDEYGEYHSLGATQSRRASFRLVGATNRDPSALKHDLAARLVVRLTVPGLGERRDDIPFLVRHLLARAAEKSPAATARFTPPGAAGEGPRVKASLIEGALRHPYTTHVRELNGLLWSAMSASAGDAIEWSDPSPPEKAAAVSARSGDVPCPVRAPDDSAPPEPPAAPEPTESEIRASLAANKGNILHTARALGLTSRYVLYRLMKRYGIATTEEG